MLGDVVGKAVAEGRSRYKQAHREDFPEGDDTFGTGVSLTAEEIAEALEEKVVGQLVDKEVVRAKVKKPVKKVKE